MKYRFLSAALALSLSAFFATASDVVINEIMYHPFHLATQAEDTGQEWIELHNRETNAVNLHGWRLTKGVDFTFSNITLPAGGYIIVAASRTNFLAQYPGVTNVVGDWEGRLSNSDDELRLLDAIGEEVDRVDYADSGEWAVRARQSADAFGLRGWDWLAPHDGGGMTLELINASMPNEYGQNWAASTVSQGTPGAANSVAATNTAPFIQDVSHFPLVPRSTETVRVTARIHDETATGLVVTLNYRNATFSSPPLFSPLPMFDDGAHGDGLAGDGLFAATIPVHGNGAVVEFYISATDSGARTRQWPAPARNAPDLGGGILPPENGANAVYQVDDSAAYSGTQPFYRIILIESERAFLASIAGNFRNSDAQANGTFVSIDANGTEEHHSTSFRRRGAGSRGAAIPNYRVSFATDHRWKGLSGVNLNSQYTHSQIAGSVLAALSGLQAEFQKPVQVRVNSVNLVNSGSPQFGSYAQSEVPDGDFAQDHFPDDPNGNIYRGSSGGHTATLAYLGTDPNSYISAGFTKTSNGAENDWSDLINLTDILNNTPDNLYAQAMTNRVNVQQWMIYFAVFTLLDSKETSLGTGQGDDFGLYRGLLDTRFQLLGHDFDTVLGQGDTAGNVNDSIFRASAVAAIDRFLRRQEFAPIYYRTLTNLLVTAFAPQQVSATLDQHLGSWVNAGVISSMKSFSVARNAGVLAQIPLALTISHSLPIQNGYPRTLSSSVSLFGFANAVETRSVLVNGTPATWSAWEARWTGTVSSLQPGINRVLVQSLDASGREFERATLDVWYDDASVVDISGDLNDDVTWAAADGPFNITTSISVPAGYTLSIEPGTTVYIAPGASITVRGRLVTQGTAAQHIHIGRNPAVPGNWGSLDFIGTTSDNILAYVDFDSCGGTTIGGHNAQMHVNNSVIKVDHCTWPSTPVVQYISFDNSSFIVQNCTFPTYPAPTGPEMLHGVNGIPFSGYGIFRDNYFGHTWGFNDTIDFTGGNRPGAILQIIGNVFDGASDDHLDLDSTDAWIEGNIFMHAHRDPTRTDNALDTASAISGGVDVLGQNPDWTIINNLFYDVDHVLLNKGNSTTIGNGGGRIAFLYNTVAHVARENSGSTAGEISVFNWSDDSIALPDPAIGSGLYAAHNIIFDAPVLQRFYSPANHTVIFEDNIFPTAFKGTGNEWIGPGTNNQYIDPRLNLSALAGTAVANVTAAQLQQAFQLRPGSPAAGAGGPAQAVGAHNIGGSNPYGIAVAGEPIGTNTSTSATLTVGPGGVFDFGTNAPQPFAWTAFKWKLDNGPWSAIIPITNTAPFTNLPTIMLSNLGNGPHTVYVSGRNDVGYFQDDPFVYPTNATVQPTANATPAPLAPNRGQPTATRTWVVDTNLTRLVINEVLARNLSYFTNGGSAQAPDLIELHNAGAKAVDISDMSITDDPLLPRKYVFPAGTMIAPGDYLTLFAANGETPGRLYLGFGLNDSGDAVYLYNRPASGGTLIDSIVFGLQLPDLSIGRVSGSAQAPDNAWGLTKPTFGAANLAQPTGDPNALRINEWFAASGEIFQQDFIELFNSDGLPVPLGNLALSHSPMSSPRESIIPALSFIAANGWQSFIADGSGGPGGNAQAVNFKLSAEGGWISLARADGTLIDMIVYATQYPDVSQGRSPDGAAIFATFNQPTPGSGNPAQSCDITTITSTLVPLNQTWRMESSGIDLLAAWRANNYNDASWFSGPALYYTYNGSGSQPPPITAQSAIPFHADNYGNALQVTVYFRTAFNFSGPTNGVNFFLNQVIDDGCVVYLNNQEIYRFGFANGVSVTYFTRPSTVSGGPPLLTGIPVPISNMVQGTNYLTVEMHQASNTSSDMAMAIGLESQQSVTNCAGTPIVLNEIFTKNNSYTNASGKIVDWVELHNPSTNIVDLSDLSLTDEPSIPRRWVFPQGATIGPGGYYVVEFDDSLPYSPFNAGFELSADSGAVYLFQRPTVGGGLLDSVVYGIQVADLTLGRATPGANVSWTLCQPTRGAANTTVALGSAAALKINEWMPNPVSGEDDWFELYNPGTQPVALGGLHLTDTTSTPLKHTIRALSFIGAGPEAWVKFIADDDTSKGGDHVGFRLANTEAIALYTAPAVPSQIDFISYTNATNGVSQGRLPDGSTSNIVYFPDTPSPEEANWLPLLNSVVINEALTHPLAPLEQAIELRNPSDVDVAIGGWFLSNAKKDLKRYLVPPGTLVPAGGFKNFYEVQFNRGNDVPPSFAFNFSKDDEVILSVADANGNLTGYRTRVKFGAAAENTSFGRYEKSTGDDFVAMSARTFGVDNPGTVADFRTGSGAPNAYPLVGPLVINEIHYHPPDGFGGFDNTLDEFIEILNASAGPAYLFDESHPTNTWRLRDGVDFNFPTNIIVPAWDYVVVVSFNPVTNAALAAGFRAKHGLPTNVVILGPWSGKLDNSSDSIELLRPDAPVPAPSPDAGLVPYILVERVKYSDSAPWPSAADGNTNGVGISLQRLVAMDYGNDPVNWVAGVPTPGSETGPAANQPPTINSGPSNLVVSANSTVIYSVNAAGAGPFLYQWRFNGAAISGATNETLVIPNAQAANAGSYSVTVANKWGMAFAGPARLSVQAPPMISQQPQSRTVIAGVDTTFIVTASGGALQYQWRFNGTNIVGATNAAFMITNAQLSHVGGYDVRVNNSFGSTTSLVATLTVLVPPSITSQPQSLSVIIGNSAGFIAGATGTMPLSYQWRFNGTNISGATSSSLTLGNVQPTNAGNYTLVVTNVAGAATSSIAVLTVVVPPTVNVVAMDANASEPGANTGTFTFTRTGAATQDLVINYIVSGSAVAGSDYVTLSGTATIPIGSASVNVIVTPLDDPSLEGDESVIVTLASNPEYLVGGAASATVVIRDDDNLPPLISILTPTNSQLFLVTPTNVSFTVSANDPDGSVAKVEFFADETNKLGESVLAPFNFTWTNAPAGSNSLTARATDNLGSTTVSVPVVVILNALPTVGIVSPVNGSTFGAPATIAINAFASDADGTVTQVNFYANGNFVSGDASAPFSATLVDATAGAYALRAVAFDNRGVSATSAVVNVVVNQPGVFDDFEPDIDLSQWSAFGGVVGTDLIATNYGGSVSGLRSLWFGGDVTRSAATRSVDTTLGGTVSFQLRIAGASGGGTFWEQADISSGEAVVLEYSVNGGTSWTVIATYDQLGANYTLGWVPQQFSIPAAAQTASTRFRWRQLSHSGGCCDHWAIDDVQILVGPTPPTISTQPGDQYAVAGGAASFTVTAFGSAPFYYQWRFTPSGGSGAGVATNILNATNAVLGLTGVTTNQAGLYSVVVSNAYGTDTSANASLSIIEAGTEYFRIVGLSANNSMVVDHDGLTSDDRGGIAVSAAQVFITGDSATARFSAANLTGGASLGTVYDGLVGDLRTETVYTFATDAGSPVRYDGNSKELRFLLELNATTGALTGNRIALSSPITLENYYGEYGFFSGYGRVLVHNGIRIYHISLPSGVVKDLGPMATLSHSYAENWGYWGVAELAADGLSIVYVRNSQTIVRTHVPDGATTNLATFSNLSDMASMTVSPPRGRWYFHYEGSAQFGGSSETLGFADAQFALSPGSNVAPTIVIAPQDAATLQGSNAAFSVTAIGTPSLVYQWYFNPELGTPNPELGTPVPGAIAPTLSVFNVQPENVGTYAVVITNQFGAITSAPVTLIIALPPVITNQPQSQTVLAGTTVMFTVGHSGDGPFTYNWRVSGFDYLTTTNNFLVLSNIHFYFSGEWSVEVVNAVGSAVSSNATLVVLSPPFFNTQPLGRQALRGMNASLVAAVDGTRPFFMQWSKGGVTLPNATNAVLTISNAQPSDSGSYQLVATNVYGSVTSLVAVLEVLEVDGNSFAIQTLGTSSAIVSNAYTVVGYYDYNGLAASAQRLFLNGWGTGGNGPAGSFSAGDLTGASMLDNVRHGLVSDLKTRKVYSLANGTNLMTYTGPVTTLIELDGLTGNPTTNIITLSTNNIFLDYYSAVFSGYGRIVLMDGSSRIYDIAVPSGIVTYRGFQSSFNYNYAYGFAYRGWGIAEQIGTNLWLAHVRDSQTIERTRVPDGLSETIAQFSNLGGVAGNFTVCLPRNRWYLNFNGTSQFGGGAINNLVTASASFIYLVPSNLPPTILEQPASKFALAGTTVTLSGFADGSLPLSYQWYFNGNPLAGKTNASLMITNVRSTAEGDYNFIVSNPVGVATSLVAALIIDYGASTSNTVPLFTMTGTTWRYHTNAGFLSGNPPAWTGSNYNDTAWTGSGRALLAWENLATITPLTNTWLALGKTSYYFRTWFYVPTNFPLGTVLRATTYIDDGAVIFINGKRQPPIRMTTGSYGPTTFANAQAPFSGDAGQEFFYWLAATNLIRGSNIVAAEVHQASATSSDIVWGMALDALVPVPNKPPVITNHPISKVVSNGTTVSFSVGASGTGPITYQWRHEGTNLPGATGSTLLLGNVQRRHAGIYAAQASSPYDTAVSSNATLTVLVPPIEFLSSGTTFTAPGRFTLQFSGDTGATFGVESSTNLLDWIPVGTVTNTTGSAQFDDNTAGDSPYKFYRLRLLE